MRYDVTGLEALATLAVVTLRKAASQLFTVACRGVGGMWAGTWGDLGKTCAGGHTTVGVAVGVALLSKGGHQSQAEGRHTLCMHSILILYLCQTCIIQ